MTSLFTHEDDSFDDEWGSPQIAQADKTSNGDEGHTSFAEPPNVDLNKAQGYNDLDDDFNDPRSATRLISSSSSSESLSRSRKNRKKKHVSFFDDRRFHNGDTFGSSDEEDALINEADSYGMHTLNSDGTSTKKKKAATKSKSFLSSIFSSVSRSQSGATSKDQGGSLLQGSTADGRNAYDETGVDEDHDDSDDDPEDILSKKKVPIDDSIEMVRRTVPESDDVTMPAFTLRVFVIGSMLGIFGAAVSQLFFFKSNAPSFSTFFIVLVSYPMGLWCAKYLPDKNIHLFKWSFSLNPGPFNRKEHLLITVLAGSGANAAYAGEIISVQELYYHSDLGSIGGLLLLMSTQLLGFGFAGLLNRMLVRPSRMVWPSTLVMITLYETLHGHSKANQKRTKDRLKLFAFAFVAIFVWQFFPAVIFPTLSSIAVLCLMDNRSFVLRTLGSGYNGFGLLDFSLDWSVIGSTGGLYTPFSAQVNYFLGLVCNMWLITPLLFFTNFWNAMSFDSPMAAHLYNSTFGRFDVKDILTSSLELNLTRYNEVKPILLTPYFALSYGVSFAVLTSAVTTVFLWHWSDIKQGFFSSEQGPADIHVQMLERSYEGVPRTYYLAVLCTSLAAAIYLLLAYPLQLPVAGLFLSILIALIFLVPVGIIAAITNTTLGLNVITEFVAGFIYPGKPIANILFKVFGYMTLVQCIDLTADMKLGLYSKIPPKSLFIAQVYGTALGSFINFLFIRGVIAAKRPYLEGTIVDPTGQWSGRKPEIFFSASVIWGLIAPKRFFSGQYMYLYWGFLVGLLLPIIPWLLHKRYGGSFWKNISVPLILYGAIGPPQVPTNIIIPGFLIAFLSQYWAVRYRPKWFEKYCYVLSSALDAGTSINALFLYIFGIFSFVEWWGNSSIDAEHCIPGS